MDYLQLVQLLREMRHEEMRLKNLQLQMIVRKTNIEQVRKKLDKLLSEDQGS